MASTYVRIEDFRNRLQVLEQAAGIGEDMERAREGRFFPLGIDDPSVSADAYFADEEDHYRDRARDAYFSVQDLACRKELIKLHREMDSVRDRSHRDHVGEASQEVERARAAIHDIAWGKATIAGVLAVLAGYGGFGLVGAIGGAVGGIFFGVGLIAEGKKEAHFLLRQAEANLAYAEKEQMVHRSYPERFGVLEEDSGVRDPALDQQSALNNVLRAEDRSGR